VFKLSEINLYFGSSIGVFLLLRKCNNLFLFFISQLVNEDVDVADLSLKCLSLLVQLYGADTTNSLSIVNIVCDHYIPVFIFIIFMLQIKNDKIKC